MQISLVKGVHGTAAIEGNQLTLDQVQSIAQDESPRVPASLEYQEIEIQNILKAMNEVLRRRDNDPDFKRWLSSSDIFDIHQTMTASLQEHMDGPFGRYRQDRRQVGRYSCPDPSLVPSLMDLFLDWLKTEFHFGSPDYQMSDAITQAICAHAYFEMIHPFADGNGRTGRLIEFFFLTRGGVPAVVGLRLADYYNSTREEYYRQLQRCSTERTVRHFLAYALRGLRDGITDVLKLIDETVLGLTWRTYVHDVFNELSETSGKLISRRRKLALNLPLFSGRLAVDIVNQKALKSLYESVGERTLARDIDFLKKLGLVDTSGRGFKANTSRLRALLDVSEYNTEANFDLTNDIE